MKDFHMGHAGANIAAVELQQENDLREEYAKMRPTYINWNEGSPFPCGVPNRLIEEREQRMEKKDAAMARVRDFECDDHQPDGTVRPPRTDWHSGYEVLNVTPSGGLVVPTLEPEQTMTAMVTVRMPASDAQALHELLQHDPEAIKRLMRHLEDEAVGILQDLWGIDAKRAGAEPQYHPGQSVPEMAYRNETAARGISQTAETEKPRDD